ncbi:MAG: sigma-70 family RNA polymerase sigma factor [Saprospiraceae bacterium]|nr:sigma-70 family RNA polymerase sigma factor [Saprospiraceae bacterium]
MTEPNEPKALSHQEKHKLFEEEFLPYIEALHTFAYHLSLDEEAANDLVQDTYMKAFRFIEQYDRGTNAKAWLFKILKNAFINEYRRRKRQPVQVDFDDIRKVHEKEEPGGSEAYVDLREEMFNYLIGDEVTKAINAMPVDFRTVILLCDVEDFSYEEIAVILDIPIGTVRSRLHRARNTLKEKLENYAQSLGYIDKRRKLKKIGGQADQQEK